MDSNRPRFDAETIVSHGEECLVGFPTLPTNQILHGEAVKIPAGTSGKVIGHGSCPTGGRVLVEWTLTLYSWLDEEVPFPITNPTTGDPD